MFESVKSFSFQQMLHAKRTGEEPPGVASRRGGDPFRRPLGKTNFPMMDIHGKKVCVLEDLRAGTFGLGWDAYLVWWEGANVPVPMPQNHHKGSLDYEDAAPISPEEATAKAKKYGLLAGLVLVGVLVVAGIRRWWLGRGDFLNPFDRADD